MPFPRVSPHADSADLSVGRAFDAEPDLNNSFRRSGSVWERMMSLVRAAVGLSALIFLASEAQAQNRPSFSCNSAQLEAELTICDSRRLSRLDVRMAEAYEAARESTSGWFARRRLRKQQINWLDRRNACENDRRCLRDLYERRVSTLEGLTDTGDQYADRGNKPSFDCRTARRGTEQRICDSERLSRLDRELDAVYTELLADTPRRRDRRRLKDGQANWLAERNTCRRDRGCIRESYKRRIAALERARVPAYQRTAEWRDTCRGDLRRHMRTACDSDVLWQLHIDTDQEYRAALEAARRQRLRRRIRDQHDDWQRTMRRCGDRVNCIRRGYRDRLAVLRDDDRDERPIRRRAYQRTAKWERQCLGNSRAAGQTTCSVESLWALNLEYGQALNGALARAHSQSIRNQIIQDNARWNSSWLSCRRNVKCLRRSLRNRIAELNDPAYVRGLGVAKPQPRVNRGLGSLRKNRDPNRSR